MLIWLESSYIEHKLLLYFLVCLKSYDGHFCVFEDQVDF